MTESKMDPVDTRVSMTESRMDPVGTRVNMA
jgi:hypothetical protein